MKKIVLSIFIVFVAGTASAEEERWYAYWALGASASKYPSTYQNMLDVSKANGGSSDIPWSGDFWGFYWPQQNRYYTLLGVVIYSTHQTSDYIDPINNGIDTVIVDQYSLSLSAVRYLSGVNGDGLFYRGDIGLALRGASVTNAKTLKNTDVTGYGTSVLAGIGYGIPISASARLVGELDAYVLADTKGTGGSLAATLGLLW